jgi:hypothetical protein
MEEMDEREDDSHEDEIKPEEGFVRHWMFINGDQIRLFAALSAAIFAVLWCFLYILGGGQTIIATILLILAGICLVVWRLLDSELQKYQARSWAKDKHSPKRDRIEIRIAFFLWLFIFISIGLIISMQWRHVH